MVWKFRTNPDRERGGGLSKTGRPEKSKSPKNKDRNYSIMSNFTTVFTCVQGDSKKRARDTFIRFSSRVFCIFDQIMRDYGCLILTL